MLLRRSEWSPGSHHLMRCSGSTVRVIGVRVIGREGGRVLESWPQGMVREQDCCRLYRTNVLRD